MQVRSDFLKSYSSARSLAFSGRVLLDANERQTGEVLESYGIRQNKQVVELLSQNYSVRSDQLLYDRGLDEIISLIFRATCEPGSTVRVFTPSYGMYAIEAAIQGLILDSFPLTKEGVLDLEALTSNPGSPSLVILCRPNNPLGTLDKFESVIELLDIYRGICPLFIDEAYIEFASPSNLTELINRYNLILGRTLSKAYGLASLRVGCALASSEWIERLSKVQKPYPVSRLVEEYLINDFLTIKNKAVEWIHYVRSERTFWDQFFSEKLKVNSFASEANFLCYRSPISKALYNFLREKGMITRLFGDDLIRITIGSQKQLEELKALDWRSM